MSHNLTLLIGTRVRFRFSVSHGLELGCRVLTPRQWCFDMRRQSFVRCATLHFVSNQLWIVPCPVLYALHFLSVEAISITCSKRAVVFTRLRMAGACGCFFLKSQNCYGIVLYYKLDDSYVMVQLCSMCFFFKVACFLWTSVITCF